MPMDAMARLRGRVAAVINTSSGGLDATAEARLHAVFEAAGLPRASVTAVTAEGIAAALDAAIGACDVLVALGGDGTLMSAAERCVAAGRPLIALPGGTMNMLARALYGPIGWERALADTLADPETRAVSGGRAQGRPFYCAAVLGAPTLWADAREALRHWDLAAAFTRSVTAIRRHGGHRLTYRMDGAPAGSAEAVAVICPLVSRSLTPDEQRLEAVALDPATARDAFRLALSAMFDAWREDQSVARAKVRSITVTAHGRIPVILDGERVRLGRSVTISFLPLAFLAITPARRP